MSPNPNPNPALQAASLLLGHWERQRSVLVLVA